MRSLKFLRMRHLVVEATVIFCTIVCVLWLLPLSPVLWLLSRSLKRDLQLSARIQKLEMERWRN